MGRLLGLVLFTQPDAPVAEVSIPSLMGRLLG